MKLKSILVSVAVGGLLGGLAAYVVVKSRNNPLNKCYSLVNGDGSKFIESLVLKVNKVKEDGSLGFEVVGHNNPESLDELMMLMQLSQPDTSIKAEAIKNETIKQVECPK